MSCNKFRHFFFKFVDVSAFVLLNPTNFGNMYSITAEKLLMTALNLIYTCVSLWLTILNFQAYDDIKINMGLLLSILDTYFPILISFYLGIDLLTRKKLKMLFYLQESNKQEYNLELKIRMFIRLIVIFLVRIARLVLEIGYLQTMFLLSNCAVEFVIGMNDFAFVYHVEFLEFRIKQFRSILQRNGLSLENLNKFEYKIEEFLYASRTIKKFYSSRLILTIFYNFIQMITSLCWIFIRVAFGHLEGGQFATFLYLIPPTFSLYTVFQAAEKCLKMVKLEVQ